MTAIELLDIIGQGETSTVQFKELLDSPDGIAAEMIAMSNSKGGIILFGVVDKTGEIKGLSTDQIRSYNLKIGNIATESVKPSIFVTTEIVTISIGDSQRNILVVDVKEGVAKPYKDNQGRIWVKQGSDKRKLTDNNEQIRLFQHSGLLYLDELVVPNTSISDINTEKVNDYLAKISDDIDVPNEQLYTNINLLKDNRLTLGGLLFFAKNPQRVRPVFCIKAISFIGNDIEGTSYRDSVDITGTIPEMFDSCMSFFDRNLLHTQQGQNFNSVGKLEISPIALEELLQNALTHRDYSKNSPIRVFIFDNRIEIISPGALPNSLTIENIKMGNAVVRNPLIVSYSSKLMKYRGVGSGIRRAIKEEPGIELENDSSGEQFIVRIPRQNKEYISTQTTP